MKNQKNIGLIKFSVLLTGTLLIAASCKTSYNSNVQHEIDSIAAKYVPDQRIGICKIEAKSTGSGRIILYGETTSLTAKQEIIKALNERALKLTDSILILPDTVINDKYMGLVTLSVINLRKGPDHKSELVSQAILGTPVVILKEENSWLLIQTPDKYISWTEKTSVENVNVAEMNVWKKAYKVIYLKNTGWINDSLPDHSGVIGDIVAGCILKKTGTAHDLTIVSLPDGRKGYIKSSDLMDFSDWKSNYRCTNESVCNTAISFLGVPYLWGGTSTKGVDCSGFVRSVYFMNGLILARDASLQALHGISIDISDGFARLDRGDLLFFGSKKNGTAHVTHVAIYLGNNEYINSSGRVIVNSLDSTQTGFVRSRLSALLSAKRVIGIDNDEGIIPVKKHPWY